MKKMFVVLGMILSLSLFLSGCGEDVLPFALIERDGAFTGGGISFAYDQENGKVYFGGEGECVQFYEVDITKGWQEAGNRVGLKINPPIKIEDKGEIEVVLDGQTQNVDSLLTLSSAQPTGQLNIYPLVSEQKKSLTLKIKWSGGTAWQEYQITIKEGTIFMNG